MKWLTNSGDYRKKSTMWQITRHIHETPDEAWRHWNEWVSNKIIGRPKATKWYTVEELEDKGVIGIYSKEDE